MRDVLAVVEAIAAAGGTAVVMTYWNPVLALRRRRVRARPRRGRRARADHAGPDPRRGRRSGSPPSDDHGLDRIFLVAPSSTDERLALTTERRRGFVYATAVMGVTGARDAVARTRRRNWCARPGAHRPAGRRRSGRALGDQAAEVAGFADAVIVGLGPGGAGRGRAGPLAASPRNWPRGPSTCA